MSGSHWWWMRGASTASCGSMPKSSMLISVCALIVMIREPPGEPATSATLPSRSTIVGAMDESGRLPGWIAFFVPCTRPNRFGTPVLTVKSSISSLRKNPVSPAITPAPK